MPEQDLDQLINAAIDEAEGTGTAESAETTETVEEVETPEAESAEADEAVEGEETEETEPADKKDDKVEDPDKKPEEVKLHEDPDVHKLLTELGVKAPKKGQRDNPIPYSRWPKIAGNFVKRVREQHATELSTRDAKIKDYEGQLGAVNNTNRLIEADPDRYIRSLAVLMPDKYGKFVEGGKVASGGGVESIPESKDDPRPQPDIRYSAEQGGGVGYSDEQFEKLNQWNQRQGARLAIAAFEKRYGKTLQTVTTAQDQAQRMPAINAEINRVKALYGDPADPKNPINADEALGDKSEILAYWRAHKCTFAEACAAYMLPRLQKAHVEELNTSKKRWLEEQKKKPARASAPPSAAKSVKDKPGSVSGDPITDIINDAIDAAGIA